MRFFLSIIAAMLLCACVSSHKPDVADRYDRFGVIVAHDTVSHSIFLVFTADSLFEGAPIILDALAERGILANFFFTGNFLERASNRSVIQRVISVGHYVGGHGNRHLLLADWDADRTPLVSTDSLLADVRANICALGAFGITPDRCRWFMPSYEWIAAEQVPPLCDSLGLKVINPTPELLTFRDYTTPDMPDYFSSDTIISQLFDYERTHGLNGAIIIIHPGTQQKRIDKLYNHLPMLLDSLSACGYSFERLP